MDFLVLSSISLSISKRAKKFKDFTIDSFQELTDSPSEIFFLNKNKSLDNECTVLPRL